MTTLRSAWDVTAGLILGRPDDQHTKRFVLTSDDMESDPTGRILGDAAAGDRIRHLDHGPGVPELGQDRLGVVLVSAFGPELHRVRTILIVEDLAKR